MAKTDVERIEDALRGAPAPLSIAALCLAAFGRQGPREHSAVRVSLHRLDRRGLILRHPRTYSLATTTTEREPT